MSFCLRQLLLPARSITQATAGGVIFGNQYFYTSETDRVKQLLKEVAALKEELDKLKGSR